MKTMIVALSAAALVGLTGLDAVGAPSAETQGISTAQVYDQGFTAYRAQKYDEAMRLFRRAADGGNLRAEYQIGEMYELARGVPEDMAQAMDWYRKAADRGLPEAQVAVGLLHANGWGVEQNWAKALTWYRRAADQGYAPAEEFVGIAYINGLGVDPNFAEARIWLDKAIEGGATDAENYLCPPYEAAWTEALMSKDVDRMDRVIAKIDPYCTDLLRRAKLKRATAGH